MPLALSTHWNAYRHNDGGAMVDEAIRLGFQSLELGYDLRQDLVAGVRQRVTAGAIRVDSVHNYCPIPPMYPMGHPELHSLADRDERERRQAVFQTRKTIVFAAEIGARCVVLHAGSIPMRMLTPKLIRLAEEGRLFTPPYERVRSKLAARRDRKAGAHLDALRRSLDELLPELQQARVSAAIENLPYWECVPAYPELLALLESYRQPELGYWHDVGHGEILQGLGFISVTRWLERLQPWLKGFHLHDVLPPARDHLPPGAGQVDFSALKPFVSPNHAMVLEPAPDTPSEALLAGVRHLALTLEQRL